MSLGRRSVGIDEPARWVFNRMADVYDARPPYPPALLDALAALAGHRGDAAVARIADIGAGIGHLALPLAERGFDVVAVEPATSMLERLHAAAIARGLSVRACHGAAEKLPMESGTVDLAIVADALHFLDAELTGNEIARVLRPRGALAIVTCELGTTPFMKEVVRAMEEAVPRRPRDLVKQLVQVSSITKVPLGAPHQFTDETPVDHATLDRILRSISFIGPAMNPARFERFRARVHAISPSPAWARTFMLRSGVLRSGVARSGASRSTER